MERSQEVLRRKLAVLGAAVTMAVMLVMAAAVAMAQATTETSNVSRTESFTIDNPCPGYEEQILFEGVFHHVVRVTQVDRPNTPPGTDIYTYTIRTNSTNVTGTGLSTGDEYKLVGAGGEVGGSFSSEGSRQGTSGEFTAASIGRIVSHGASPDFMYHETVHYTFFPDGTATGEVQNVWATCTGSG
jgi:hypothetical protein